MARQKTGAIWVEGIGRGKGRSGRSSRRCSCKELLEGGLREYDFVAREVLYADRDWRYNGVRVGPAKLRSLIHGDKTERVLAAKGKERARGGVRECYREWLTENARRYRSSMSSKAETRRVSLIKRLLTAIHRFVQRNWMHRDGSVISQRDSAMFHVVALMRPRSRAVAPSAQSAITVTILLQYCPGKSILPIRILNSTVLWFSKAVVDSILGQDCDAIRAWWSSSVPQLLRRTSNFSPRPTRRWMQQPPARGAPSGARAGPGVDELHLQLTQ